LRAQVGEALQAERCPLEEILDLREQTWDYIFAAQWQQDPQPEAGVIVKQDWLHRST